MVQLVNGGKETVDAPSWITRRCAVSFVGSTPGWYVYSRATANGKRFTPGRG
ncbi:MAG: hypothetical protein R3A10_07615 [Caldilineaceae bacterium]